ncbi:MAG TPA: aminotransferase class V-fold PLP-dependent enzyme [Allosphingosinicella sp.]
MSQKRIYLDHAATTPVLPAAREAMAEALERWHNPSSPHAEGRAAKAALEDARARVASALGWGGKVIFTSGASEALAIALGRAQGGKRYVSAVEHDAVFRAAPDAERLPGGRDGIIDLGWVNGERPVVAVQHANNETGILQPLGRLAGEVRAKGGILVADCAQTAGKLPLPDADMIAISAHKFGGSPGIGALLVRDLSLLEPTGGQEQGYRAGTENLPAILGMVAALEAGSDWLEQAAALRQRLEAAVTAAGGEVVGAAASRIPTIGAYRMPGVPSNAQLIQFDMAGIAVSAGSACSSGSLKASHVLAAIGWDEPAAREVIRVSFGRDTSEAEIDRFADMWAGMAARRRSA